MSAWKGVGGEACSPDTIDEALCLYAAPVFSFAHARVILGSLYGSYTNTGAYSQRPHSQDHGAPGLAGDGHQRPSSPVQPGGRLLAWPVGHGGRGCTRNGLAHPFLFHVLRWRVPGRRLHVCRPALRRRGPQRRGGIRRTASGFPCMSFPTFERHWLRPCPHGSTPHPRSPGDLPLRPDLLAHRVYWPAHHVRGRSFRWVHGGLRPNPVPHVHQRLFPVAQRPFGPSFHFWLGTVPSLGRGGSGLGHGALPCGRGRNRVGHSLFRAARATSACTGPPPEAFPAPPHSAGGFAQRA